MVNEQLAAIYVRQSKGNAKSIGEQEAEGRKACDREGWQVAGVYTDTVGASRHTGKARPDWDRLMADLEAGRFGVLVMWESSRGDRVAETWLGLLRRCREAGVLIHVTSHGHTYDMVKRRDWKTLAEDGVDSEDEAARLSERIRRGTEAIALEGKPHGRTPYGFERIYDEKTRKLREQRADLATAPVVREIVSRLAHGDPISAIQKDLNRRRIPSPAGSTWSRAQVTKIAMNPAYIGKRRYRGEMYDATWPALVSEQDFYAVARRLGDPERKTTRPGRYLHLLSCLAVCGQCGAQLRAASGRSQPMYTCSAKGCSYAPMDEVDLHVGFYVRQELYRPEWREFIAAQASGDKAAVEARAEADRLEHELDELAGMLGTGSVTARTLAKAEAELRPKIDAARKQAAGAAFTGVPDPDDILAGWYTMDIHQQRQVVSLVCSRMALYKPVKRGRRPWNGERVGLIFRDRPGEHRLPTVVREKIDFHEWVAGMREHDGKPNYVDIPE